MATEDVPLPENGPAVVADKVLRGLTTVIETVLEAYLKAEVPICGAPVLSQVVDFIIGKIGDVIYKELAFDSTMIIIDCQTKSERDHYYKALQALQTAQSAGDPAEIEKQREAIKEQLAKLIHFDGTAHS